MKLLLKMAKEDPDFRKLLIASSKQGAKMKDLRKVLYNIGDIIDELKEYQKEESYKKDYGDSKDDKEYSDILKEMDVVSKKFSKHLKRMGYKGL